MIPQRPQNWVFLGDSLTEGVGSSRTSYVQEFAAMMRERNPELKIQEIRLRFDSNISENTPRPFNLLGHQSPAEAGGNDIWIWNLASEGTTITHDKRWLPLLQNLRPEKVFLLRGALESIERPIASISGDLPWWVPKTWRGYAAMDPRCYFSSTWWRRVKQKIVDYLKQKLRHSLLQKDYTGSLLGESDFEQQLEFLCQEIKKIGSEITGIGLPPVSNTTFPGSQSRFDQTNTKILHAMNRHSGRYVDLAIAFSEMATESDLYYRDGFHHTKKGSFKIAKLILEYMTDAEGKNLNQLSNWKSFQSI
jgi:lysophospholipase L1-like esterase